MSLERLFFILGRCRIFMDLFEYLLEIPLLLQVLSDLLIVLLSLVCHLHVDLRLIHERTQLVELYLVLVICAQLLDSALVLCVDGSKDGLVHPFREHPL